MTQKTEYYKKNLALNSITHKIIILNKISKENDSKSFSISCNSIPLDELYDDIKKYIFRCLVTELKEAIVINCLEDTTHIVTILDVKTKNSKSFSISAVHLSSLMIAKHLQNYLCHGQVSRKWCEDQIQVIGDGNNAQNN